MAKSRLHELSEHGVSVWMDTLSREMLETGELQRLIEQGYPIRRSDVQTGVRVMRDKPMTSLIAA